MGLPGGATRGAADRPDLKHLMVAGEVIEDAPGKSSLYDGHDKAMFGLVLAQNPSQGGDLYGEVCFFNELIPPDQLHQLFFG